MKRGEWTLRSRSNPGAEEKTPRAGRIAASVHQRCGLTIGKPHHRGGALGYLWRCWNGDDVFLVVLHRVFTLAWLL